MKRCSKYGRMLDLSRFGVDRTKRAGVKSWCKSCDNARSKAYYEANRERDGSRARPQARRLNAR
jgi:hypothetical protein